MNLSLGFLGDVDLTDWVRGLLGGIISGGANAITGAFGAAIVAPQDFALLSSNSFKMMGIMFIFSGILGAAAFLAKKPIPDLKHVETTVRSIETQPIMTGTGDGTKTTISTTKESHTEPIAPVDKL